MTAARILVVDDEPNIRDLLSTGLSFAGFEVKTVANGAATISAVLEEDAEIMTNTGLEELLVGQPPEVQEEILRINTDSRFIALQVALLVPILAGLLGILNALRMRRLPDPKASPAAPSATR